MLHQANPRGSTVAFRKTTSPILFFYIAFFTNLIRHCSRPRGLQLPLPLALFGPLALRRRRLHQRAHRLQAAFRLPRERAFFFFLFRVWCWESMRSQGECHESRREQKQKWRRTTTRGSRAGRLRGQTMQQSARTPRGRPCPATSSLLATRTHAAKRTTATTHERSWLARVGRA